MIDVAPLDFKGRFMLAYYNRRVSRFRCLALAAAFLALLPVFAAARELPKPVRDALRATAVPASSVAVVVQDVAAARPALSVNAGAAMNPASVMKLVTSLAALELLGPAYRWKTQAYVAGSLRDGMLEGDLVLKGYGDPKLDYESFWMLLRALRGKGLRELRGDLVLDRSFFAQNNGNAAAFDGDGLRPYNVLPDALLVHYKSLRFAFVPEPEREAVRIYVEPRPPGLEVANTLRLSAGGCLEGRAFRDLLQPTFEPGPPPRVAFAGRYPIACGEKEVNVALRRAARALDGNGRRLVGHGARGRGAGGCAPAAYARVGAARRDRARRQQVLQQRDGAAALSHARHLGQ
jgi:D-alanyl-D-alanine carboxypeptidase/D-alanyl-D-alanine-endopeptidase (penicillin-binding protein 4)